MIDPDTLASINDAFQLSKSGLQLTGGVLDQVTKLKGLVGKKDEKSTAEAAAAILELSEQIQNLRVQNLNLKEQLLNIREAALEANKTSTRLEKYDLLQTPGGSYVRSLKAAFAENEPAHYACPQCWEQGRISVLQGGGAIQSCNPCKTGYRIAPNSPRQSQSINHRRR